MLAPSPQHRWVAVAVVANAVWTALFVRTALRRGLSDLLMTGEIVVTGGFCLAQSHLLPVSALDGGASWVAGLASVCLVALSVAWAPSRAVPAGGLVIVAHLIGARHAGAGDGGLVGAGIQVLQLGALTVLMALLRRAAGQDDQVLLRLRQEASLAAALTARRQEELRQNDILHGTVVATLTIVATGALAGSTQRLRAQAVTAGQELAELAAAAEDRPAAPRAPVRLDERLRLVAGAADVEVDVDLIPVIAEGLLADTVASAATEALANVSRHSKVRRATLCLTGDDTGFVVEIADLGVGFDPASVPSQRYGVRSAILQAMTRVGGEGMVATSPGSGSRVVLTWPRSKAAALPAAIAPSPA